MYKSRILLLYLNKHAKLELNKSYFEKNYLSLGKPQKSSFLNGSAIKALPHPSFL